LKVEGACLRDLGKIRMPTEFGPPYSDKS